MIKQILCCLVLIGLAASRATIPELYKLNNGYFSKDYSVTYNNPVVSGQFGVSSEAGDIDNDGIPDILLGNPTEDNNRGTVYVIYGKPGSLRQFNSMDDFQPSDGFIIKGPADGQKFGFSVGAAGDINGDGIDDIIIGSSYWSERRLPSEVRAAYVLFGRKSSYEFPSVVDVDSLSPTQGFKIFGTMAPGGLSEFSVSGAGDVNGDGISDIIIGAFALGEAYVIFGSRQGFTDMKLPPVAGKGFTLLGSNFDHFGNNVSKVGDFNGDGVDDVIIGARETDMRAGKAYLIYGRRGGFPQYINSAYLKASDGMVIQGASQGHYLGCSVSGAGDFNGDGLQDVIIGAFNTNSGSGAAYVIFGSRQNPGTISVNGLSPSRGFTVTTSTTSSRLGHSVGGGRDINGDGKSDIIIGAPAMKWESGGVYIIYGYQASSFTNIVVENLQPNQGFAMFGTGASRYGEYVTMVKDINGDGLDDFIVGARKANDGKGAAYLFYLPCPAETHFLSNGACIMRCSANCKHCSIPNTCQACAQGFGLLEGHCILCNEHTHLLNNGVCVERIPENCQAWLGPEICQICNEGFGLLHNKCQICFEETHFLNNGVCIMKCSENCARCSKPNSCDTCTQNFGFFEGSCITCDPATHLLENGVCVGIESQDPFKQIKDLFGGWFH